MAEKCTKLIFSLSKSAKLNWGLQHAALKTIYTGAVLPLLLYGAPEWTKAIEQTQTQKSTKINKYKNSKGIQNSVK